MSRRSRWGASRFARGPENRLGSGLRVTDVELRALEKYYATTTGRGVLRRTALKWLAPLAVLLNSSVVRQRIPDHLRYELQNPVDVFRRGLPKQRTKRDRATKPLRNLIADISRTKAWKNKHICLTIDR